jgi:hypothetical protein
MDDAGIILATVAKALDEVGVRYFVGGSAASSVYGTPRSTQDVDFIVDLTLDAVPKLMEVTSTNFHIDPQSALEAVHHRDMFNIIHRETMYKADLHLLPNSEWGQMQMDRRRWLPSDPHNPEGTIPFASPEDTILSKLRWFRLTGERSDKQWGDIQGVLREQDVRLDRAYLDDWSGRFGPFGQSA